MKRYFLLLVPVFFLILILILQTWIYFSHSGSPSDATDTKNGSDNVLVTPIITSPGVTSTPIVTPTSVPTSTPATPVPTKAPSKTPAEITRGNTAKKQLIFTFDCGSGAQSAQQILDISAKHGVHVTFFVTGKFVEANTSLVKAMSAGGHEIYNHSYDHPHFPTLTDDQIINELKKTEDLVVAATGKTTKPYFRLPYGDHGDPPSRVWNVAGKQGYQSIFWTLDGLDWDEGQVWNGNTVDASFVKNRIFGNLKNGSIILMHVGDNITGQILDEVFTKVEADGYTIVPLSKGL